MKTLFVKSILSLASTLFIIALSFGQDYNIQYFKPYDLNGATMFETPKQDPTPFEGLRVRIGGSFTQQFQALDHENGVDLNTYPEKELIALTNGFNLATANLNMDVQLADGVRLNLVTYLSSRHHPEAWVKGGYLQFDKLPFMNSALLDNVMEYATIKVGHMEINYGDAHFRRTDNGHALHNPFVGNLIMDAFNTEIGAEVMVRNNGLFGMLALTGGEIKGDVTEVPTNPNDDKAKRSPSLIGKVGIDKNIQEDFRVRLTGSIYTTASSRSNSLYSGDRGGSRYYLVLEPVGAATDANFTSGRYNPGLRDEVTAFMINPFVQFKGLEFFGTFESANGKANSEVDKRSATQMAAELLYRFGKEDHLYIGGRYNTVNAETGGDNEVTINRYQLGLGWFLTKNILLKAEYVNQEYLDFPESDIRYEGKFNGVMVEASIGF